MSINESVTMRNLLAVCCVCLGVSSVESAGGQARTNLAELAKAPAGKKIAYGEKPLQFGELTLPTGAGPHPVVIFIHGGCWLAQYDIKHSRALANGFARAGMAVWNLEYRRVGDEGGGWPGSFLDVANGAKHLRALAKEYPLDLARVIVAGHSAGGHFALWLAANDKLPGDSEIRCGEPIAVVGVLGLAPAPQLAALHEKQVCDHVIDKLMGDHQAGSASGPAEFPNRYRDASPAMMAPLGVRQILVIGKDDSAWGWVGKAYAKAARAAGDKQIEIIEVPDAGHFEVIDPKSTAWPAIRDAARSLLGIK
ncbi:MAG: alpha/beta hydrolase [Planctomycetes bacterium]|nr:alpha/beta hydrolase [Planctomycetota bacterium]